MELDSFVKATAELEEDISDILTGTVPLIILSLTSPNDATIPCNDHRDVTSTPMPLFVASLLPQY
jgi:hypothetical protein